MNGERINVVMVFDKPVMETSVHRVVLVTIPVVMKVAGMNNSNRTATNRFWMQRTFVSHWQVHSTSTDKKELRLLSYVVHPLFSKINLVHLDVA